MSVSIPGTPRGGSFGLNEEATLDGTTTSVTWAIPARVGVLMLQVYIDGGSGSYNIETTCNKVETIEAGQAKWFDLYGSAQSSSKQIPFHPARGVRITRISGTLKCAISGQ